MVPILDYHRRANYLYQDLEFSCVTLMVLNSISQYFPSDHRSALLTPLRLAN